MKGKQLQYHANIDKSLGKGIFLEFVQQVSHSLAPDCPAPSQ